MIGDFSYQHLRPRPSRRLNLHYFWLGTSGWLGELPFHSPADHALRLQKLSHGVLVRIADDPGDSGELANFAGRPLRGMADVCMAAIGVDTTAVAVGRHYGARPAGGLLDGWLVHESDGASIDGVTVRAVPLLMTDVAATAKMARHALEVAGV
jgi:hypothetical protein